MSILSIRSAEAITQAVDLIRAGELVIIPTDTIYGIATLPENQEAITHLYEVRNRSPEPAMPFLIAGRKVMPKLARINRAALRLARRFWPGALTLVLPPCAEIATIFKTHPIALRVPNYPDLVPLLEAVGGYLFTSGAICSGYPPAITAQEAADLFGDQVALILDGGPSPFGIPSTIVDCISQPPTILRRGVIPEEKIWDALNMPAPDSDTVNA